MSKKTSKGSAYVNYPNGAIGSSLGGAQSANAQQAACREIDSLRNSLAQMMACSLGYTCGHYIHFEVPAVKFCGITIRKSYRVSRFLECENGQAIVKRKERILGLWLRAP